MFSYEIWDKRTDINEAKAEVLLNKKPLNIAGFNGEVILIKNEDDRVIQFQPFDHREQGFKAMTREEAEVLGQIMIDDLNNPPEIIEEEQEEGE